MSGFSSSWLTLREPYDRRARNAAVLDAVASWAAQRPSVAAVDLACGLGSTLRAVAERLPRRQSWRLVDNDLSFPSDEFLAQTFLFQSLDEKTSRTYSTDFSRAIGA